MTAPRFGNFAPVTPTNITTPQELRDALQKGFVEVTFTKETGEQVTLKATTDLNVVPKEYHPAPKPPAQSIKSVIGMPAPAFVAEAKKPTDPNHITFFSPERNGWRSLRFERLIQAFVI